MAISAIGWLCRVAASSAVGVAALTLSSTILFAASSSSVCSEAIAEYDVAIQTVSRALQTPATQAAGMPFEVAAGVALRVVIDLLPQTELRRQCYDAVLRHAGYRQVPPYDLVRGHLARTHPELPPDPPTWIKTSTGCEVGIVGLDDIRGWTAQWDGACVAGKASGRGELVFAGPAGSASYAGDVLDGLPEGHGLGIDSNGSRYEGSFRAGRPDGKGVLTTRNGDRVEGDFRVGLPHGQAAFTDARGNRYEGHYADGLPDGYGKTFYVSGNRYEGEYRSGKRNGRGTFFEANGGRYEGEWHDDKRQGHGVLISPDGSRLEGEFANDRLLSGSTQRH